MVEPLSGPELRRRRRALDMTQAELAEALGVSRGHVCRMEDLASVSMLTTLAFMQLESLRREAA